MREPSKCRGVESALLRNILKIKYREIIQSKAASSFHKPDEIVRRGKPLAMAYIREMPVRMIRFPYLNDVLSLIVESYGEVIPRVFHKGEAAPEGFRLFRIGFPRRVGGKV